jgi:hypothetical protein
MRRFTLAPTLRRVRVSHTLGGTSGSCEIRLALAADEISRTIAVSGIRAAGSPDGPNCSSGVTLSPHYVASHAKPSIPTLQIKSSVSTVTD